MGRTPDKWGLKGEGDILQKGRPTKYRQEYCQEIIEAARQGISPRTWAAFHEPYIPDRSVYDWAGKHEDFSQAKKEAEYIFSAWYEKTVIDAALGKTEGVNTTLLVWLGKNFPGGHGWTDNQEHTRIKRELLELQKKYTDWKMSGGFDSDDVEKALETIAGAIDKTVGKK